MSSVLTNIVRSFFCLPLDHCPCV